MGIVTFVGGNSIRGSRGGVTYRNRSGVYVLSRRSHPHQPESAAMRYTRNATLWYRQAWKTLSAMQKALWHDFANAHEFYSPFKPLHSLNGFQLFCTVNIQQNNILWDGGEQFPPYDEGLIDEPQSYILPPVPNTLVIDWDDGNILASWSDAPLGEDHNVQFYMSKGYHNSCRVFTTNVRFLPAYSYVSANSVHLRNQFFLRYGVYPEDVIDVNDTAQVAMYCARGNTYLIGNTIVGYLTRPE